jgi:hypothetical protein
MDRAGEEQVSCPCDYGDSNDEARCPIHGDDARQPPSAILAQLVAAAMDLKEEIERLRAELAEAKAKHRWVELGDE